MVITMQQFHENRVTSSPMLTIASRKQRKLHKKKQQIRKSIVKFIYNRRYTGRHLPTAVASESVHHSLDKDPGHVTVTMNIASPFQYGELDL